MQKLNRDGSVSPFHWAIDSDSNTDGTASLLSVEEFIALEDGSEAGVLIKSEDDLMSLESALHQAKVVGIYFPVFADGRGFSTARWVREKLNYQGEIVAVGHFMQDQLHYLKRCGFDAFAVQEDADIPSMIASLNDFSEAYQASADQPTPLFRRR